MLTTVFTKWYTKGSAFISSTVDFQDQHSNILFGNRVLAEIKIWFILNLTSINLFYSILE